MRTTPEAPGRPGRGPALACVLVLALDGCAAPAGPPVAPRSPIAAARTADLLVPPGYGSLLQDDITLALRTEELQIKVTPLEEWVLRLTAPDTYARLSALAATHRTEVARRTGVDSPALFLVSIFGRTPGATFVPEDLQIVHRSRRLRPLLVRPMTADWEQRRVQPNQTQAAVYAFSDEIDLEQTISIEYGDATAPPWEEILRRLEAERGRARARAGLGGG